MNKLKKYFGKSNIISFLMLLFISFAFCGVVYGGGIGNPIGPEDPKVDVIIGTLIKAVLGIVGSLALLAFVYGGFVLMLSSGNSEQVQKGKNILIWASVGLVVIFVSYAAVKFIIDGFTIG